MVEQMVDVEQIRFTQEHVFDSFNANDSRAMTVLDLIECILRGEKTPRDLPLIRIAAKKGAYWCVDNRRLFVYKHCQLGQIPVQVCNWKDNREFELKWKNGLATRSQTSSGRRCGLIQRTELPFPFSAVAEPTLSTKNRHPFSPAQQERHDAAIASLRARRDEEAAAREATKTASEAKQPTPAQSLLEVLQPASKPSATRRVKRKRGATAAKSEQVARDVVCADAAATGSLMQAVTARSSDAKSPCAEPDGTAGDRVKRRPKKKAKRKRMSEAVPVIAPQTVASGDQGTVLRLSLDGDESGDDDYAVEVFVPS